MRRLLPLLVLSAALVLIGGCAATANANPAAWHQPAGASAPATDPSTAGSPSGDLALPDPIKRAIQPVPGRLVLFPSYMWHGTIPFEDDAVRTTIAFDVIPKS